MPTYDYQCEKCQQSFEAFQSMKDAPYTVCPKELCRQAAWGEGKVKRLLGTGAGLIFKGSGFYITDYRSAGYKEAAKKESGTSSSSTSGAKTESGKSPSTPTASGPKSKGGTDAKGSSQ